LVLNNEEGKKLMGEGFYYFGVMMMLLDNLIPGPMRERLVVSYIRCKGG
jgi:WASH complex subunit strumpellin